MWTAELVFGYHIRLDGIAPTSTYLCCTCAMAEWRSAAIWTEWKVLRTISKLSVILFAGNPMKLWAAQYFYGHLKPIMTKSDTSLSVMHHLVHFFRSIQVAAKSVISRQGRKAFLISQKETSYQISHATGLSHVARAYLNNVWPSFSVCWLAKSAKTYIFQGDNITQKKQVV